MRGSSRWVQLLLGILLALVTAPGTAATTVGRAYLLERSERFLDETLKSGCLRKSGYEKYYP